MPSLPDTLRALLALQDADTHLARLQKTQKLLDNGDAATQAAQNARTEVDAKRAAHHTVHGELKDSELKLATLEGKRKTYQQRLYQGTISNPKELSNMEREIEALGRQQNDLDTRILELMDSVEQSQTALTVAEEVAREADTRAATARETFASRREALGLEINEATRARAAASAAVDDPALLKRYEALRVSKAGVGIARIVEGSCAGCHMKLPSALIKDVREAQSVQVCDNCGRLLAP